MKPAWLVLARLILLLALLFGILVVLTGCQPTSSPIPVEPPVTEPMPPSPPPPQPPKKDPKDVNVELEALKLLATLHNEERFKAGCPELQLNSKLIGAAQLHCEWMADNKKMTHEGIKGSMPWTRVQLSGYEYTVVGENIAFGYRSPRSVMTGWMNSTGHKANILNRNYRDFGVAVSLDSSGVPYWCTVFGRPKSAGASAYAEPESKFPPAIYADINEINDFKGFNAK
jgi:uncharacterized protein YkwD